MPHFSHFISRVKKPKLVAKNYDDAKKFLSFDEVYPERQFIELNKNAEFLEPHPEFLPSH